MSEVTALLQVPHHGYRCKQMADGGWQITFSTPELPANEVAILVGNSRSAGYLVSKPNLMSDEDIPTEDAPVESGMKPPGQRLRAVIYRVWEQNTNQAEDFNTQYYPRIIEQLITKYKDQLS